jgi:hypothetical protein
MRQERQVAKSAKKKTDSGLATKVRADAENLFASFATPRLSRQIQPPGASSVAFCANAP